MAGGFTNISQIIREIDYLGQAVFKDTGDTIALAVWVEFEQMIMETPQWTGTTAASWSLSMGGVGEGGGVETLPERTREQALQKGHMNAVSISVNRNFGRLEDISTDYRYKAIVIENYAPGFERSEAGGNLRDVNKPGGMLAKFEQRLISKNWDVLQSRGTK